MLDIFCIHFVYTYDEWCDEHAEWEISDDTWWDNQLKFTLDKKEAFRKNIIHLNYAFHGEEYYARYF